MCFHKSEDENKFRNFLNKAWECDKWPTEISMPLPMVEYQSLRNSHSQQAFLDMYDHILGKAKGLQMIGDDV